MRLLRTVIVILILFLAASIGVSVWMAHHESSRIQTLENASPVGMDAILVLGCGVQEDGTPSPALQDRMTTAVILYKANASDTVILSGDGTAPGYDEPGAMAAFAIERGIPEEALILDREGVNTEASVARAKEVYGANRVVIVSQAFHLPRALFLAQAHELEARGISASLRNYGPKQFLWTAREVLARDAAFLKVLLHR